MTELPKEVAAVLDRVRLDGVAAWEELPGGAVSRVFRVHAGCVPDGSFIIKCSDRVAPDAYEKECLGLSALAGDGGLRVPKAIAYDRGWIMLEDLGPQRAHDEPFWEQFAERLHRQHAITARSHGYYYDNYLGETLQRNPWSEDGSRFFVEHRVLRYLDAGRCAELLTADDRRSIERFCERFVRAIASSPPSLVHGDLWINNILTDRSGTPASIDPAVYFGFREADLSMIGLYGNVPAAFWNAYARLESLKASDGEWRRRIRWFDVKEHLAMVAAFGHVHDSYNRLRAYVDEMLR